MSVHVLPILNPLLPPSPSHPSGSSQCTSPEHPVSRIKPGLETYFTYDNIHVSVLFSQIIPPLPSPTESKRLFFTFVSLLLSRQGGKKFKLFLPFHISVVLFVGAVITHLWSNTFRVPTSDHTTELKKGSFASNHLSI